jgi:hypothetical protein
MLTSSIALKTNEESIEAAGVIYRLRKIRDLP